MDRLLTAGQTIAKLEELRLLVEELVSRESSLIEERDRELEAIQRKYGLLKVRSRKRADEREEAAREALEVERSRLESRFSARRRRIDQALENARAALEEEAEQTRSQQKYENQKDLLQANRQHDTDALALEKTWKAFSAELAAEVDRLSDCRDRAWEVFKGYGVFRKWLSAEPKLSLQEPTVEDEYELLESLRSQLSELEVQSKASFPTMLAKLFSVIPFWVMLLFVGLLGALGFLVPQVASAVGLVPEQILIGVALGVGLSGVAFGCGFLMARGRVQSIVEQLACSNQLITRCQSAADQSREAGLGSLRSSLEEIEERLEEAWREADFAASQKLESGLAKVTPQHARLIQHHDGVVARVLGQLGVGEVDEVEGVDAEARGGLERVEAEQVSAEAEVRERFSAGMSEVVDRWSQQVPLWVSQLEASRETANEVSPSWDSASLDGWEAPQTGEPVGEFADLEIDLKRFVGASPIDTRMAWNVNDSLRLPLSFKMPIGESLLFESDGAGGKEVVDAMNGIVLRLLMRSPVGRLRFTLIDPVGLGQNFAGLMHLADHDDQLINRRIWTQASQIDQCLRDLTEHMEKVTQMYLRNEYDSLAEYNQAAGNIAEKYHVLVIADFPVGFSEAALRRLQSIAVSGPRCGVFLLLHRDRRQALLDESVLDDLQKHCVWLESQDKGYQPGAYRWSGTKLDWKAGPSSELAIDLIHKIGQASIDSNRVEVPFSQVVPSVDQLWSLDTSESLSVPIGRTGASKLQYLTLGKGTQQHALIAGKTGSGKSTLFHVIVTNLALWCRPDQVEFYLVDFKKGVEFKCYATHALPHAKVVAIESDREFGLSVLERVDQELRRRGDLFRACGVQDLAGYQASADGGPLPRTLVMIDEFQEYFVEDDRVAQNAAVLLDRIVRQGRAFGIHVILGSQTLGGAYTLARTTFAQMVVRIALQCDEADSYLIMDENNAAPRLLSRPGEGIYNDSSGVVEGNSPFQTVWLTDRERDEYLSQVKDLVSERNWTGASPVVFEGNAPADVRDNTELAAALAVDPSQAPETVDAWLGAPNSIKGPTCATFGAQTGGNLLVLGQNDEMAFSLVLCSLISLASQYPSDGAEFVVIDALAEHSAQGEMLEKVLALIPQSVRTLRDASLESLMGDLDAVLNDRSESGEQERAVFVIVLGLQSFKKLRPEDEFSFSSSSDDSGTQPGDVLDRVIREGPSAGLRVIATIDSYNSSQRFLSRKALSEFEMRVLFQMSANDSAALIDNTKASQLGLHRALFYHERKGYLETFRPYSLPDGGWLSGLRDLLGKRASQEAAELTS